MSDSDESVAASAGGDEEDEDKSDDDDEHSIKTLATLATTRIQRAHVRHKSRSFELPVRRTTPQEARACGALIELAKWAFEGAQTSLSYVRDLVPTESPADSVFHRTVEAMRESLDGGSIPIVRGPLQPDEEEAARRPGPDRLRAFAKGDVREAAALMAHAWVRPVILYSQICRGVAETRINRLVLEERLAFLKGLWERVGFHVRLLMQATQHGIMDPKIPMHSHRKALVYRLLVHGKYLDALLALHAIVPEAGIGATMAELEEFARQAVPILTELERVLPIGPLEVDEPELFRNTRIYFQVVEFTTPRVVQCIGPALVVAVAWANAFSTIIRQSEPALIRARGQAGLRLEAAQRYAFNERVATSINADVVRRGRVLGSFVYPEDGSADHVQILLGNATGVARTSLSTGPDQMFDAIRPGDVKPYSMQMVPVEPGVDIKRFVFNSNPDAGAYSRIAPRALALLSDAKFWFACSGLLQSYADGTPVDERHVLLFGASLADCSMATLRGVAAPEDAYRWVRSFLDLSLGAWTQGIWLAPGEAWVALLAGALTRRFVPLSGLEGLLWFTDNMLIPGTVPNLYLSLGYICWVTASYVRRTGTCCSFGTFAGFSAAAAGLAWAIAPYAAGAALAAAGGMFIATRFASWAQVAEITWDYASWPMRSAHQGFIGKLTQIWESMPGVSNLAKLRMFAGSCWAQLGLGEVVLRAAEGKQTVLSDYQAAATARIEVDDIKVAAEVARITNKIFDELPTQNNNPLMAMNNTLGHMHRSVEGFKTLPAVAPLVEIEAKEAAKLCVGAIAMTAVGTWATTRVVEGARERFYPARLRRWAGYLGTPHKYLQHVFNLGFSVCRRKRGNTSLPSDEETQPAEFAEAQHRAANRFINADQERSLDIDNMRQRVAEWTAEGETRERIARMIGIDYGAAWKTAYERGDFG